MAGLQGYPKELHHPNGYKVMLAYDVGEEKEIRKEFQSWATEHRATSDAAAAGKDAPRAVEADDDKPVKGAAK